MTWTWAWHGELRGYGVDCAATMAIASGCECVLDLFPGLGQILEGCARHSHRSACAVWMAGPKAFPPAQDPT